MTSPSSTGSGPTSDSRTVAASPGMRLPTRSVNTPGRSSSVIAARWPAAIASSYCSRAAPRSSTTPSITRPATSMRKRCTAARSGSGKMYVASIARARRVDERLRDLDRRHHARDARIDVHRRQRQQAALGRAARRTRHRRVAAEAPPPPPRSSTRSAVRSWSPPCAQRAAVSPRFASSVTSGAAAARSARTSAGEMETRRRRTARRRATTPGASSMRSSTARRGAAARRATADVGRGGDGAALGCGSRFQNSLRAPRRRAAPAASTPDMRASVASSSVGHIAWISARLCPALCSRLIATTCARCRAAVQRGATAHRGRPIEQAERRRSSESSARRGPRGPGRSSAAAAPRAASAPRRRARQGSTFRPRRLM